MKRNNGSIQGVVNSPSSSSAKGIWTLENQYVARVGNTWPTLVPPLTYRTDPYSTNLFAAITFENSGTTSLTGGAYNNVASGIRVASGQSAGVAVNLANQGNGTFTSPGVGFPNSRYVSSWTLQNASSTTDLTYWDTNIDLSSANYTVEMWVFFPAASTQNLSTFATNSFSGGYYTGVSAYLNGSTTSPAFTTGFFTNFGTSTQSSGNNWTRGTWFHVAYVFRASATDLTFINGTLLTSNGSGSNGGNKLAIGGTSWDGLGAALNRSGIQIMDLRIYTIAKYTSSFSIDITDTTKGGSITT